MIKVHGKHDMSKSKHLSIKMMQSDDALNYSYFLVQQMLKMRKNHKFNFDMNKCKFINQCPQKELIKHLLVREPYK